MSLFVFAACSEDSQKSEEPTVTPPGGDDTTVYWETTYADLSALVNQGIDEVWSAAAGATVDQENRTLYVQDQKGNRYKATVAVDGTTVTSIVMELAGQSAGQDAAVWESLVTSFRDLKLGTFLGTKFKDYTTGEGGVKQTTEETLPLLTSEANMLIFPIFGIQKTVYCCPVMDKDKFRVELCRNYLALDFSTLGRYVGGNIDEVLQEYYAIGNKVLFGTAMSYIYFDSAIDAKGNSYTAYFDSDKTLETILEISVYVPENDQTIIGDSYLPKLQYSFSISLSWKGIDVFALFQGAAGRDVNLLDAPIQNIAFRDNGNVYKIAEGRWAYYPEQGIDTRATATYPRLSLQDNSNNYITSTLWKRSGDYLKLRNVEIGYTFSMPKLQKAGISKLRVYLCGVNLLTVSELMRDYSIDPELLSGHTALKSYNLGLNIVF